MMEYIKKAFVHKEDMCLGDKFIGPQPQHNWLFAEETHEISGDDIQNLKEGHCLALNIDNEFVCFVCFVYLRREDL